MINAFTKYMIYDRCIEIFFKKVFNNFKIIDKSKKVYGKHITEAMEGRRVFIQRDRKNWVGNDDDDFDDEEFDALVTVGHLLGDDGEWTHEGIPHILFEPEDPYESITCIYPEDIIYIQD